MYDYTGHIVTIRLFLAAGESWTKENLEKKSFEDLHKLWFVLLKEWNYLLSEELRYESSQKPFPLPDRIDKVNTKLIVNY